MSRYSDFFLNSASNIVQLDTLEISHPSFTQTYWVVRNAINGLTATIEDSRVINFLYYPLQIESNGLQDDLDFGYKISIGDLGNVFPVELDHIDAEDTYSIKPTVVYRAFRSDDLNWAGCQINGPYTLEIKTCTFTKTGVGLEVRAPAMNIHQTGEIYSLIRFPMLRGFL